MEPSDRPYVDPATEPGDAGTEPWADDPADGEAGGQVKAGPLADPVAPAEEAHAIDGSPADKLTEETVSGQDEDIDRPAGD